MVPLAFKLTHRPVLVIGAGRIGVGKARILIEAGAKVTMIADRLCAELPDGLESIELRRYCAGDLRGYSLVISATGDPRVNDLVVDEARHRGIWINVVDDPLRSDFFFTAVHRSGDVIVSISTQGASPALAQEIRARIRESLPRNLGDIAQRLKTERRRAQASGASTEDIDWKPRIRELLASDGDINC
ncbi:MAG TPA: bifunctional precorrin-2 dehydrogenase/sirohydrochlorin ferrochelatase [Acidimicrobiales bacterium]|nr:bifunctional precorrin-2 dehydrogenase/sirohydrochlorin ferrochelatase [Acidimicrobiales bacterium]